MHNQIVFTITFNEFKTNEKKQNTTKKSWVQVHIFTRVSLTIDLYFFVLKHNSWPSSGTLQKLRKCSKNVYKRAWKWKYVKTAVKTDCIHVTAAVTTLPSLPSSCLNKIRDISLGTQNFFYVVFSNFRRKETSYTDKISGFKIFCERPATSSYNKKILAHEK